VIFAIEALVEPNIDFTRPVGPWTSNLRPSSSSLFCCSSFLFCPWLASPLNASKSFVDWKPLRSGRQFCPSYYSGPIAPQHWNRLEGLRHDKSRREPLTWTRLHTIVTTPRGACRAEQLGPLHAASVPAHCKLISGCIAGPISLERFEAEGWSS
jgi:hypothetical protein